MDEPMDKKDEEIELAQRIAIIASHATHFVNKSYEVKSSIGNVFSISDTVHE